jgi:hypothetical protein
VTMNCTNCAHPIPADLDGRQPPWCPRCGASIKRADAITVADAAASPSGSSAPKPSQGPALLQETRAATTKVDYYVPKRGWRTAYEATVRLACWKQHTCSACGAVYRYRFRRSAEGDGGVPELAQQNAEANLMKKVASDVEIHPCPACGFVQPDMAAKGKVFWHSIFTAFLLPASAFIIIPAWCLVMPLDQAAMLLAGAAAVAAVGHWCIALQNPNRDRSANQELAAAEVAAGKLEIVQPGPGVDGEDPPRSLTLAHLLALGAVLAAIPASLAPVLMRPAKGWPINEHLQPHVLAPGDSVPVVADQQVQSLNGLWRAKVSVKLLNAEEVGGPPTLEATCHSDSWGKEVWTGNFDRTISFYPAARLIIPNDPALGGKTLNVQLTLAVTYPVATERDRHLQERFKESTTTVHKEVMVQIAEKEVKEAYWSSWEFAVIVAGSGSLLGGLILVQLARSMRNRAHPVQVFPATREPSVA